MASHIFTALLAFFFIFSNAMQTIEAKDLDFYYFVLMWPGAYCKQTNAGCCLPKTGEPAQDFFVGGLLPYSNDGTPLTKCHKSSFDINELSDLEDELNYYWSNIKCPSSQGSYLWKSAWKTYGVCTGLSEHDYFKKALDLRAKIDLLSILEKNGILATDNADYSLKKVNAAVSNGIGATTAIRCSTNSWDEYQIYQVYVCVDKDATNIIPCPILPTFTCAPRVVFPQFTLDMLDSISTTANPIKMRIPE